MRVGVGGLLVLVACTGVSSLPRRVQHRYTREEVDFFVGYAVEVDTVFVFPFEDTARFKSASIQERVPSAR